MRTKSGRGDVLLVCMVLFLVVFGLAVLYSTGSYNGSVRFGDAFYYMKKQFFAAALGMLAMYLISSMTNLSLDEIGKVFDNRDHSTVLYSIQQIEKKMKKDAAFAEMVKEIKTNINSKR